MSPLKVFKLAKVILLSKANRDLSKAKGWRPIALLSFLGKGLDGLFASRMTHMALSNNAILQQLFGALSSRSTNDIVSCVIRDVEHAIQKKEKAVLVTLDLQGAFDTVLHAWLLQRMNEIGWQEPAISWTKSFLQELSASVRREDGVIDPILLECVLPQGSPLSQIIFLL